MVGKIVGSWHYFCPLKFQHYLEWQHFFVCLSTSHICPLMVTTNVMDIACPQWCLGLAVCYVASSFPRQYAYYFFLQLICGCGDDGAQCGLSHSSAPSRWWGQSCSHRAWHIRRWGWLCVTASRLVGCSSCGEVWDQLCSGTCLSQVGVSHTDVTGLHLMHFFVPHHSLLPHFSLGLGVSHTDVIGLHWIHICCSLWSSCNIFIFVLLPSVFLCHLYICFAPFRLPMQSLCLFSAPWSSYAIFMFVLLPMILLCHLYVCFTPYDLPMPSLCLFAPYDLSMTPLCLFCSLWSSYAIFMFVLLPMIFLCHLYVCFAPYDLPMPSLCLFCSLWSSYAIFLFVLLPMIFLCHLYVCLLPMIFLWHLYVCFAPYDLPMPSLCLFCSLWSFYDIFMFVLLPMIFLCHLYVCFPP